MTANNADNTHDEHEDADIETNEAAETHEETETSEADAGKEQAAEESVEVTPANDDSFFGDYTSNYAKRKEETMSFTDYLNLCKDDHMAYANAAERLLDVIGEPEYIDTSNDPGPLGRIHRGKTIAQRPRDREPELEAGRRDPDVAGRGDRRATARTGTVDRGNRGHRAALHRFQNRIDLGLVIQRILRRLEGAELRHVGARRKGLAACAVDHNCTHGPVRRNVGADVGQFLVHGKGQGIARLGAIERDPEGLIAKLRVEFVCHFKKVSTGKRGIADRNRNKVRCVGSYALHGRAASRRRRACRASCSGIGSVIVV